MPAPPLKQSNLKMLHQNKSLVSQNLSDYYPFNVTVSHLSPRSIEISWSCKDNALNDRYEVCIRFNV